MPRCRAQEARPTPEALPCLHRGRLEDVQEAEDRRFDLPASSNIKKGNTRSKLPALPPAQTLSGRSQFLACCAHRPLCAVPPLPSTTAVSNPPSPDSSPTHSPRSSCADLGLHTTKQREGDALLKALLEEVRGTKQELKSEISVFYQTVERRLVQTEEKMNSILALLPFNAGGSSASPAHTSTSPSPQILSASMRADLTRQLPFLSDFSIESTSVPFVVDDLRCDCVLHSGGTSALLLQV